MAQLKAAIAPKRMKDFSSRRSGRAESLLSHHPLLEEEGGPSWARAEGETPSCLELLSIVEADHHSWHHPCSEECLQYVSGYGISYQVEVQWIFPFGWRKLA